MSQWLSIAVFAAMLTACGDEQAETPASATPHNTGSAYFTTAQQLSLAPNDGGPAIGPVAGSVFTVELVSVPSTVPLGATVVPRRQITFAAQVPGRIEFLAGAEGTRVRSGQLLARIDDRALLAQRRALWAELANVSAALQNSHVQLYRQARSPNPSPRGGMGTMQMFDRFFTRPASNWAGSDTRAERYAEFNQSRVGVEQAQSAVMQVQSRLDELDARLRETQVITPISGVILAKFGEIGDTVQPGQPLLEVADPSDLQIKIDLPTRLLKGLKLGMVIKATMDANDESIDAVLERIYPAADPSQHTVTVKLRLPRDARAAPGMYTTVIIPQPARPAPSLPVIPASTVIWRGSQPSVFLVTSDNRAEMRLVRVGDRVGDKIVVLSGLRAGDRILSGPPLSVAPGRYSADGRD